MISRSRIIPHKVPEIKDFYDCKQYYLATIEIADSHKVQSPLFGLRYDFLIGSK